MAQPPPLGALALHAANVRALLERALAEPAADPDRWAEIVHTLDAATRQLTWARDAATVLARRGGLSWPRIQALSGIPDATLYARARRFAADTDTTPGDDQ